MDAVQPLLDKPLAPLADRRVRRAIPSRHRGIRRAFCARQYESRAESQRPIRTWSFHQPNQCVAFLGRENQHRFGASSDWHAPLDHNADPFSS
jgi:hypothetical protein